MLNTKDLKPYDILRIKFKDNPVKRIYQVGIFIKIGNHHCQLHGDFIDNTIEMQKIKMSGKISGRVDILFSDIQSIDYLDSVKDKELIDSIDDQLISTNRLIVNNIRNSQEELRKNQMTLQRLRLLKKEIF